MVRCGKASWCWQVSSCTGVRMHPFLLRTGDDDTLFYVPAVLQLLRGMDHTQPVAISDNLWLQQVRVATRLRQGAEMFYSGSKVARVSVSRVAPTSWGRCRWGWQAQLAVPDEFTRTWELCIQHILSIADVGVPRAVTTQHVGNVRLQQVQVADRLPCFRQVHKV